MTRNLPFDPKLGHKRMLLRYDFPISFMQFSYLVPKIKTDLFQSKTCLWCLVHHA